MYPVCTEYSVVQRDQHCNVNALLLHVQYTLGFTVGFHSYAFDCVLQYKVTDVCEHVPINFKLILVPYHNVLNEPLHGPGSPGRTIR